MIAIGIRIETHPSRGWYVLICQTVEYAGGEEEEEEISGCLREFVGLH